MTEINPACCGEKGCGMAEKCAPSVCEHGQLARQCWVCELEAECDKQKQLAAHWQNMAAMHKLERNEARAECEAMKHDVEKMYDSLNKECTARIAAEAECERLRDLVHVPGAWKCAQCNLELIASVLAASSNSIHADNRPQECPNNCGPMWRVTERDQRKEAQALREKEFLCAVVTEKELAAKQAKIDVLMLEYCPDEMTKEQLDSWGKHQVAAPQEVTDSVNRALSGERREG